MRKQSFFIILLVMSNFIYSMGISGTVKVEDGDKFGVFVYIEESGDYDITSTEGTYSIKGLKKRKNYTVVFQKDNYPVIRKEVQVGKRKKIEIDAYIKRDGVKNDRYKISGFIKSSNGGEIFIKILNKGYGLVAKPNRLFERELQEGEYSCELIQKGSYSKKIKFRVFKDRENSIGSYEMVSKPVNSLNFRMNKELSSGYLFLYNDEDEMVYSARIKKEKRVYSAKNLVKGKYRLKVKSYGYKDYNKKIDVNGVSELEFKMKKLKRNDNLYLNIYPDDLAIDIKLFDGEVVVKKIDSINGLYVFDELDSEKNYRVEATAKGYKKVELKNLKSGEELDVAMLRDINGAVVKGVVYPFVENSVVYILDDDKILAKTYTDENGEYEIEIEKFESGRKYIRVSAMGFKDSTKIVNINKNRVNRGINISLESLDTVLRGKVKSLGKELEGVMVILEDANFWTLTDKEGNYSVANIEAGEHQVRYKKIGYRDQRENFVLESGEELEFDIEMYATGELIIKSDKGNYFIYINGKMESVHKKTYIKELALGEYELILKKKGYMDYRTKVEFGMASEAKIEIVTFRKLKEYKKEISLKILEVLKLIEKMEIEKSEDAIYELEKDVYSYTYREEIRDLKRDLKRAKGNVFDIDREIRRELLKIEGVITTLESDDIPYYKKREKLERKYREAVDYLEKILREKYFTSLKYEIYTLEGEIYEKMGMLNSSKKSYLEAKRYR